MREHCVVKCCNGLNVAGVACRGLWCVCVCGGGGGKMSKDVGMVVRKNITA